MMSEIVAQTCNFVKFPTTSWLSKLIQHPCSDACPKFQHCKHFVMIVTKLQRDVGSINGMSQEKWS